MKPSTVFRFASVTLGVGLLAFLIQYSLESAESYAKHNAVYTTEFNAAAFAVTEYRKQNGKNPPQEFLKSIGFDGYEIYYSWPPDSSFSFQSWSIPFNFAIGRWNGDYMEWFDSASGKSTTGRKDSQVKVVIGLWPEFAIAIILIIAPFILLRKTNIK